MDDNIEISRDKKNPTWAWVWDGKKPDKFTDDNKRIIVDACGNGCVCVMSGDETIYSDNGIYDIESWLFYEIIKEPTYRPIYTLEEYIEATKDRKDLRAISKDGTRILSLQEVDANSGEGIIYFSGNSSRYIYENYVWLDDRSPVGVKCS